MSALTSQKIATWLEGQGVSATWLYDAGGFERASDADYAVMVTFTGGPGLQVEDLIDVLTFQIRFRGPPQDDTGLALTFARTVDQLVVNATRHGPTLIGDVQVQNTARLGAAPAIFGTRDVNRRVQVACNYLFETGY